MLLPPAKLAAAMAGCTRERAEAWAPALSDACALFGINTEPRLATFVAQVGHESGALATLVENLNYSAERLREVCIAASPGSRWRSLLPRVADLARHPDKLANAVYSGRLGNGDEASGDGWTYRGRGPIQTTGKANYQRATEELHERMPTVPDFVRSPDALLQPKWGALASALFWHDNELNELADAGDMRSITKRINGGLAGYPERMDRYRRALSVVMA